MTVARHIHGTRGRILLSTGAPLRWALVAASGVLVLAGTAVQGLALLTVAGAAALGGHSILEQEAADVQWEPVPTPAPAVAA
ncbi:MAG TPA: hypothetical protein VIL55_07605 [Naasia sp.]|jgi:hypothetical protein